MHEALLYEKLAGNKVACKLCARYCVIPEGSLGACACRLNEKGVLYSLSYGKSTGLALDPIEKKPFYHFKPGTDCISFGTPGCNFFCLNCQNWQLSQSPHKARDAFDFPDTPPTEIARAALPKDCAGIAYTYSEPTIFFEYARDTILEAKKLDASKYHVFVSNGFFSKECFDLITREKLLDAIRIDLKSVNDSFYQKICGIPSVKPVKENIERVFKSGIHLEVIALVIPSLNDSEEDLRALSKFVASVSKDIPLHFIRFFPQYEMADVPMTPEKTLLRAREIALSQGLNYVYVGNTLLEDAEDTSCPECKALLVKRSGFGVKENNLVNGCCQKCGKKIYGVW